MFFRITFQEILNNIRIGAVYAVIIAIKTEISQIIVVKRCRVRLLDARLAITKAKFRCHPQQRSLETKQVWKRESQTKIEWKIAIRYIMNMILQVQNWQRRVASERFINSPTPHIRFQKKNLKIPSIIFDFFPHLIWGWLYNYRKRYLKLNCSVRHYSGIFLIFAIYKNISKFIIVFWGALKLHRAARIITKPGGSVAGFHLKCLFRCSGPFYFR